MKSEKCGFKPNGLSALLNLLKLSSSVSAFQDHINAHQPNLEDNSNENYFCVFMFSKIFIFWLLSD